MTSLHGDPNFPDPPMPPDPDDLVAEQPVQVDPSRMVEISKDTVKVALTKDTSLVLPEALASDETTSLPRRDVPYEVYFNTADLLMPLSLEIDEKRITRLSRLGAGGLAEQIGNVERAHAQAMASRFISRDHVKYDAFRYGTQKCALQLLGEFELVNEEDLPGTEIDDAIEVILQSELFASISIETVYRDDLNGDGCSREYAIFGTDKYRKSYLLARWGIEMPSMTTLMNARYMRQAGEYAKRLKESMKVIEEQDKEAAKEGLIVEFQNRWPNAGRKALVPSIPGAGAVAFGLVGALIFSLSFMWILAAVGTLAIMVGLGRATRHLHVHGRVETVRAVYGGREYLDRFLLNGQRDAFVWRGLDRVYVDRRLRKG